MKRRAAFAGAAAATAIAAGGAQPASAQLFADCHIGGGGQILAANGDQATFGGSASATVAQSVAHQVYVDHGPAARFRFRSLPVAAVVCNPDARRAELTGTGVVDPETGPDQVVAYEIGLFAPNGRQLDDTYRLTLSNGYTSGEQPVERGNITIVFGDITVLP